MVTTPPRPPLQVQALRYVALPTPYRHEGEDARAASLRFGQAVGTAAAPLLAAHACDDYVLAATLNSPVISDPAAHQKAFRDEVAASAGRAPAALLNAYECIGWALALRYVALKAAATGQARRVLMQVVDADVHGLRATWETRTYGHARFGITSVVLEVAPEAVVEVGVAPVERSMMKFSALLRQWAQREPQAALAVPFFPEPARSALHRAIPGLPALPDRHDAYGHCFGSDPWIALGRHSQAANPGAARQERFVVASLALNGYHGLAAVELKADADIAVEVVA